MEPATTEHADADPVHDRMSGKGPPAARADGGGEAHAMSAEKRDRDNGGPFIDAVLASRRRLQWKAEERRGESIGVIHRPVRMASDVRYTCRYQPICSQKPRSLLIHRGEQIGGKGDADHERERPAAQDAGAHYWASPSDRRRGHYSHGREIVMRIIRRGTARRPSPAGGGRRFLINQTVPVASPSPITVVVNWQATLKR